MKTIFILPIAILLTITGCSSIEVAPKGEDLIWSSSDNRPEWTVNPPKHDDEYMYFVGISNKHGSERGARDDAQFEATAKAASYIKKNYSEETNRLVQGSNSASGISNATITIDQKRTIKVDQFLAKQDIQEWYLEKWEDEEGMKFWSAYVITKLPILGNIEVDNK